MSVDAGMSQIMQRMGAADPAGYPDAGIAANASLEVQVGNLAGMIERQLRRDADQLRIDAQAVAPVDIGPLDFTITGGAPKFKTSRAAGADMSPQEGFFWFVQRLSLAGLTAGDVVNLSRTGGQVFGVSATRIHTFACPVGVGAGLGVADWEPGSMGLVMRPDDSFWLDSAGTLTATEIILTGQAIQVAIPWLGRYLM